MVNSKMLDEYPQLVPAAARCVKLYDRYVQGQSDKRPKIPSSIRRDLREAHMNLKRKFVITGTNTLSEDVEDLRKYLKDLADRQAG